MSDVSEHWAFLPIAWRVAYILTGCPAGAARAFQETVDEVLRHPEEAEHSRMRVFFFTVLRRRCLRFPANCELTGFPAALHRQPEPGRSALTLLLSNALSVDDLSHAMELGTRAIAEAVEKTRADLRSSEAA